MNFENLTLSEIATGLPMATEILRKNQLDFCCGGKQLFKEACEKKNLNMQLIINELKLVEAQTNPIEKEFNLAELTAYIIRRYHEDLRKRFPELITLADKVQKAHAGHPLCPQNLHQQLSLFFYEMKNHMEKEETVLFPLINAGQGKMAGMPIKVMLFEHDSHGNQLAEIRKSTQNFKIPEDACPTWIALYKGLEKLELELMEHIHLENNVLFPKALAL